MAKFVPKGHGFMAGKIHIPPEGLETKNKKKIGFLRSLKGYGVFFYEVPDSEEIEKQRIREARALLGLDKEDLPPVENVGMPDIEEEEAALMEDEAAKQQDIADAEFREKLRATLAEANAAKREATKEKRAEKMDKLIKGVK